MFLTHVAVPGRHSRRGNARFRKTRFFGNRPQRKRRSRGAAKRRVVLLGPFGEPLTTPTGLAAEMPFRFSTKFQDAETGLYYYGYRYYETGSGKWLSRDPIGEHVGLNLYCFVRNRAVESVDTDGRWENPVTQNIKALGQSFENQPFETMSKADVDKWKDVFTEAKKIPGAKSYLKGKFREKFNETLNQDVKDQALALEFFERYLSEKGGEYRLTNAQLVKLIGDPEEPSIPLDIRYGRIFDIPKFTQSYTNLIKAGGIGQYDGQVLWQISNGTLGRYVLSYKGKLCCPNPNQCSWRGTVKLEGENYDFDPDWGWPPPLGGGRTAAGERNVRRTYVADVGKGFAIRGEAPLFIEFSRGGKPVVHDATGISGGF